MQVLIIVGDAMYPDQLNEKLQKAIAGKELIDVKTSGFSAQRSKNDYVILTVFYK